MSEHSTLLVDMPISDDSKPQKQARTILPILARQAMARQKISYKNLGEEIGVSFPLALKHALGCIRKTLGEPGKHWKEDIPHIQGLVVNHNRGLPGVGVTVIENIQVR